MKKMDDRATSTELGLLEAIKLKEDMVAQLKEREEELVKDHGQATDVAARLDHYNVLHRLAKNRA